MKTACVVFFFFFFFSFLASRRRTRAGSGARGTSLCEACGRAHQFPLLPRESGAAWTAARTAREREELPPSLNATMALCRSPSPWANYERIPNISDFIVDLKREREREKRRWLCPRRPPGRWSLHCVPREGALGEEGAADEYVTSEFCEGCTASMWENPRDVRNHD